MECNACRLEIENLLSSLPSKWRSQIVEVICDHIVNQEIDCLKITECLSAEMTTLDYGCLADSQSEWDALTFLGKFQTVIDAVCETLETNSINLEDSFSVTLTGDGSVEDPLVATAILKPTDNNILTSTATGLYVPPSTIVADTDCLTFDLTTDANGTKTYTPTLDLSCITDELTFLSGADNGLHVDSENVHLGGTLLEDTEIGLDGNDLLLSSSASTYFEFTPTLRTFNMEDTSTTSEVQTVDLLANICADAADYNAVTGYLSQGMTRVQASDAILGYSVPIEGNATPALVPKTSSYFEASAYTADVYGNEITLNSPYATLTSGTLVTGSRYRVAVSSGGADFTPSGAANNTVGTEFVANGVTPTWGTGTLELLGSVILSTPGALLTVSKGSVLANVDTDLAAPNDFRALSIVEPTYCHLELSTDAVKNAAPLLGYLADGTVLLQVDSDVKTARIGVSVPSLTGSGTQPDPTQYTCVTDWNNTDADVTTQGLMRTYSPYVSFRGVLGVNGDDTQFGINAELPTNPLHVNNTADVYPLRLQNPKTPASANATGVVGEMSWDTSYVYICIGTNTWRRMAHVTW